MSERQDNPPEELKDFRVEWEFDAQGVGTPIDAARQAWLSMRRYDSTANVFKVYPVDGSGDHVVVDLQEIDEASGTLSVPIVEDLRLVAEAIKHALQAFGVKLTDAAAKAAAQAGISAGQSAAHSAIERLVDHAMPDNWSDADELSAEHVNAWQNALAFLGRFTLSS